MNDHAEVCPLSRPTMLQSVSSPLQEGFRFFRNPLPAAPTAFLAVRLPSPAALRAYPVPQEFQSGTDPSCPPTAQCPCWPSSQRPTLPRAILAQACQHIWLVNDDDV